MNAFLFMLLLVAVCVALWLIVTRKRRPLYVAAPLLSPLLLLAMFLTVKCPPVVDGNYDSDEAPFKRLGSLRAVIHGFDFPESGRVVFGDETKVPLAQEKSASDDIAKLRIAGFPFEAAELSGDGDAAAISLSTVLDDGHLYTAGITGKADEKRFPFVSVPIDKHLKFCVTEGENCKGAPTWEIDDRQIFSISKNGSREPACKIPRLGSVAGDRIFPLENYGRVHCEGGAVPELDYRSGKTPLIFFAKLSEKEGLSLYGAGGEPGNGQRIIPISMAAPLSQPVTKIPLKVEQPLTLNLFRFDVSEPEEKPVKRAWFGLKPDSLEIGASRLRQLQSFSVERVHNGGIGSRLDVRLKKQYQLASLPAETQSLPIGLVGHGDRGGVNDLTIPFFESLAEINSLGAAILAHRDPGKLFGLFHVTNPHMDLAAPGGTVKEIHGSDVLGVGDPERGRILMSVSALELPYWPLLAILLGAALIRCWIRVHHTCCWPLYGVLVFGLIDMLLVLRLSAAIEESALLANSQYVVPIAIAALVLIPFFLDGLLYVRSRRASAPPVPEVSDEQPLQGSRFWFAVAMPLGRVIQTLYGLRLWFAASVPLVHIGLTLAGMRESIPGIGLRISAILVPCYVVSLSVLAFKAMAVESNGGQNSWASRRSHLPSWAWLQRVVDGFNAFLSSYPRLERMLACFMSYAWLLCVATGFVVFWLASDSGAAIYFFGPALVFGLLAVGLPRQPWRSDSKLARVVPWLTLFLTLGILFGSYLGLMRWVNIPFLEGVKFIFTVASLKEAVLVVALLLPAVIVVWRSGRVWRTVWMLPALLIWTLLVIGVIGAIPFGTAGQSQGREPAGKEVKQYADWLDARKMDGNALRIARVLYPERLEESFSREGLGMEQVFSELKWLTDDWSGHSGKGLLTTPPRKSLNEYDNVPASHIIAPYGMSTAWFLVFFMVVILYMGIYQFRRSTPALGPLISLCALSVFTTVSIYMLLANLQIVPFTGRNLYLVSCLSLSDLVEGFLLAAMVLVWMPDDCVADSRMEGERL